MPEGSGVAGYLLASFQNSAGGASSVQTGSMHAIPFLSESLKLNNETLRSASLRATFDESNPKFGLRSVGGDIQMEIDALSLGFMLKAALGSVTTTSVTNGQQHEFNPITDSGTYSPYASMQPFTAFVGRDVGCHFRLYDCVGTTLELSIANGEFVKATMGVVGLGGSLSDGEVDPSSIRMPSQTAADKITWVVGSCAFGGASITQVQNLSIKLDNKIAVRPTITGSNNALRMKRDGLREWRVSGSLEFENLAEYNKYEAETTQALELQLVGDTGSANNIYLKVHDMRYDDFVPGHISGPGPLTATFEATAQVDASTSKAFHAEIDIYSHSHIESATGQATGWDTYGDGI